MKKAILIGLLAVQSIYPQETNNDWELARDKNGVIVFERDVSGSRYREVKGVILVHMSIDQVLAMVWEDHEVMCDWIYSCGEIKMIDSQERVKYFYLVLSTMWPVKDRDNVIEARARNLPGGAVEITLSGLPEYIPPTESRIRIVSIHGKMTLTPVGNVSTRIEFVLHMDPGGWLPSAFANSFSIDFPWKTLQNIEERLKNPKYVNTQPHFLTR